MARRKARSLRAQMAVWNSISREMQKAAFESRLKEEAAARCGCKVNAPEADPKKWVCPCGEHCKECNNKDKDK